MLERMQARRAAIAVVASAVFTLAGCSTNGPTGNRDFASLSPALAQTFYIGDGRTATGRPQRFHPPTGATRLYFGVADAWAFEGPPGFFADNSGSFKVAVRFR